MSENVLHIDHLTIAMTAADALTGAMPATSATADSVATVFAPTVFQHSIKDFMLFLSVGLYDLSFRTDSFRILELMKIVFNRDYSCFRRI